MPAEVPAAVAWLKPGLTVACLALLWAWESLHPYFERRRGRLRHARHNLAIAVLNTAVLALLFGAATVAVAEWAERLGWGLLHQVALPWPGGTAAGRAAARCVALPLAPAQSPGSAAMALPPDAPRRPGHGRDHGDPVPYR